MDSDDLSTLSNIMVTAKGMFLNELALWFPLFLFFLLLLLIFNTPTTRGTHFFMDNKEDDEEDCFPNIDSNFNKKAGFLPVLTPKCFFDFAGTMHTYSLRY